jgi:hypothetical protein
MIFSMTLSEETGSIGAVSVSEFLTGRVKQPSQTQSFPVNQELALLRKVSALFPRDSTERNLLLAFLSVAFFCPPFAISFLLAVGRLS